MKATGIISEFNPFHNGHKYLIDSVRNNLNPDAVVCVMSGNFVQRGMPAHWDKRTRAAMAVSCGADLVLELPAAYAVNAAPEFAYGGVGLLKSLGCIDTIAFGSELGDGEKLSEIAGKIATESDEFKAQIKFLINSGLSYPKAYSELLNGLYPGVFDGSNNILAIEYLKQAKLMDFKVKPYTVCRKGSGHNDLEPAEKFASGTAIRKAFDNNIDINNIIDNYIPEEASSFLESPKRNYKETEGLLFAILRYKLLTQSPEMLSHILEVSEGLENRLKDALIESNNLEELIQNTKSKRFTYARISRILMHILLDLTAEKYAEIKAEGFETAMVLAANEKGRALIKEIKKQGGPTLISNLNKQMPEKEALPASLAFDIVANDIYSILSGGNIYKFSDYVCSPAFLGLK